MTVIKIKAAQWDKEWISIEATAGPECDKEEALYECLALAFQNRCLVKLDFRGTVINIEPEKIVEGMKGMI